MEDITDEYRKMVKAARLLRNEPATKSSDRANSIVMVCSGTLLFGFDLRDNTATHSVFLKPTAACPFSTSAEKIVCIRALLQAPLVVRELVCTARGGPRRGVPAGCGKEVLH